MILIVNFILFATAPARERKETDSGRYGRKRTLKQKALIAIFVIAIVVLGIFVVRARLFQTAGPSFDYSEYVSMWKPSSFYPMQFSAVLNTASYDNLEHNSLSVILANLNMLKDTGVGSIRIDLGFDPWLLNNQTAINEMGTIVNSIRQDGLKLIIADSAAESYRRHKLDWTQFQSAWIQRVNTLAELYKPDYYIVVKEPGWYVPMVSDARTNPTFQSVSSWTNLTLALTEAVHSVSPNTKVGVAISASSLNSQPTFYGQYLDAADQMTGISFLGFDIYTPNGFNATSDYVRSSSPTKSLWIAEAWSEANPPTNPAMANSDAVWIQALYYFAQSQIHAEMIIPFYDLAFAQYAQLSGSVVPSVSFFDSRTPVFYEYQRIIQSNLLS